MGQEAVTLLRLVIKGHVGCRKLTYIFYKKTLKAYKQSKF